MKHSNKTTTPLSQGEVSSLRGSNATEAIHTLARHCETSQRLGVAIHESKIDCHEFDKSNSRNDKRTAQSSLRGSGEATTKQSIILNKHKIDCHESANADSRNDDFPNLPRSWQVKTLGEVCDINPKNKLDDNLEVSFIPMNLILDKFQNKFSYETKIWKNIKKGYTHLQNNCIALAKITPCFENGKCVILDDLKNGYGAGTTEIIILLPNAQKAFVKYIFYFLNTQSFIEQGKRNFKGTAGQLRISTDFVSNCKIPIPPLEIQKRIVKRLDEAFVRIESGTKHLQSAKDNLAKYKQSLLKSAFNGTLTNESIKSTHPLAPSAREGEKEKCNPQSEIGQIIEGERESRHASKSPLPQHEGHLGVGSTRNDEDSPSLAEGARGWVNPLNDNALDCHALKSPLPCGGDLGVGNIRNDDKDSLNGESANLPQGWTIKTLGEIFKVVGGGTPSTAKKEFWSGNIAWITSADIDLQDFTITPKRFITDKAIQSSTTNLVEKDTIIVVTRVGLGKVGITDRQTCFSQDSQALIPLENINLKFMAFQIKNQAKNFIAVSRGTTINGITKSTLKEVKLVIPPLETQKQIVAILERHFTSADKVSAYIDSCLTKAKQLKSSLLKSTFEGTLTNETTHPLAPSAEGGGMRKVQSAVEGKEVDCYESLCDSHNEDKAK